MSKMTFYRIAARTPKTVTPRARVSAATKALSTRSHPLAFHRRRPLSLRRIALARIRASK